MSFKAIHKNRESTLMFKLALLFIAVAIFKPSEVQAGKVDQVKQAVLSSCNKTLGDGEVMDAVIKAFDCTAGSDVSVGGCSIKCLKENSGNVVGK